MNPEPISVPVVAPARPEELAQAFHLVFLHVSREERESRVANALELIRQGELDPAGILVARIGPRVHGAIICQQVPGASGLVWPPQAHQKAVHRTGIEDQLVQAAVDLLRGRGVKLGQSLLTREDLQLALPLERNGFRHITSLWYMRHDLDGESPLTSAADRLRYLSYTECDPIMFRETLVRTYEQTLDCPEVNGVRTIEEVLEGHRSQGWHEPERWWLALDGNLPVAVMLLAETPDTLSLDISYIGVVPEARRQGIGRNCTREALKTAREAGLIQLTLAVDVRNQPAAQLYRNLGFKVYDRREVFLAIWPLQ